MVIINFYCKKIIATFNYAYFSMKMCMHILCKFVLLLIFGNVTIQIISISIDFLKIFLKSEIQIKIQGVRNSL